MSTLLKAGLFLWVPFLSFAQTSNPALEAARARLMAAKRDLSVAERNRNVQERVVARFRHSPAIQSEDLNPKAQVTQTQLCAAQREVIEQRAAQIQRDKVQTPQILKFNEEASCGARPPMPTTASAAVDSTDFQKAQIQLFLATLNVQAAKEQVKRAQLAFDLARNRGSLETEESLRQKALFTIEDLLSAALTVEGTSPLFIETVNKELPAIRKLSANFCGNCETHDPINVLQSIRAGLTKALALENN